MGGEVVGGREVGLLWFCSDWSNAFAVFLCQLDDWVAAHEAAEEESKKAREDAMAEEGWTVVVRSKVR